MKIIKYGAIPCRYADCDYCGAELEFTPKDIDIHIAYDVITFSIICPICGKKIIIDEKEEM